MVSGEDKVNFECLRSLYRDQGAARTVLDHIANRARNLRKITVDRILTSISTEGKELSRGDVISVFRELENCGCGTFITGRKGHPSRFEWRVQMTSVGRVAAGESEQIEEVAPDEMSEEESGSLVMHTYRLRPDVPITLELPIDLTPQEASRIARFIETLPFNEGSV